MTIMIGRTSNKNDTATLSDAININATTSTKIADANDKRTCITICLECGTGDACIYIKLQAASIDNDKKGIILFRVLSEDGSTATLTWEMKADNIYTGEISAIAEAGTHNLYVTEY